ncbi:hypothetical protein M758_UG168600, partial [Ceratodon purpureus]
MKQYYKKTHECWREGIYPKSRPKIGHRPINGLSSGYRIHLESWQVYGEEAPEGKFEAKTRQGSMTGKCHEYHMDLGRLTFAQTCQETLDTTDLLKTALSLPPQPSWLEHPFQWHNLHTT